jgi:hypothetical protein
MDKDMAPIVFHHIVVLCYHKKGVFIPFCNMHAS